MQPNLQMSRPAGPGKLVDPNLERRFQIAVQSMNNRMDGIDGRCDELFRQLADVLRRLAVLEGNRTVAFVAVKRKNGKWGVNDAAGLTIEKDPLNRAAAEWLAQHLNEAGPAIPQEEFRTLMNLAKRKAEDAA